MTQSLSGRHFLKLLDFSSEEIVSLVDLAQDLKEKKHAGVLHKEARISSFCLRKPPREPVARLRLQVMIWAWA